MPALFRGPRFGYRMTAKDIDWLARSMWGEASSTEGKIAVAWAHMMRFHLIKYRWQDKDGFRWDFNEYMRAHSQPINPDFLIDGSACVPGGRKYGKPDCDPKLCAKRLKYQTTPYDLIPEINRRLAEAFAEGEIENPFSEPVYDFAACSRVTGLNINNNCFWRYSDLPDDVKASVIPGNVYVGAEAYVPPEVKPEASGLATVVVLGIVGLVVWRIFWK